MIVAAGRLYCWKCEMDSGVDPRFAELDALIAAVKPKKPYLSDVAITAIRDRAEMKRLKATGLWYRQRRAVA